MQKNLILSIPTPCSQKWSNLTSTPQGGFCNSCHKTVVDFTKMSDEEITNFFHNRSSQVCGQFHPTQLKTYKHGMTDVKPGYTLLKAAVISGIMLFVNNSYGQIKNTNETLTAQEQSRKSHRKKEKVLTEYVVRGVVRDMDDASPLPGVNIVLKGTDRGTSTDADGEFVFPGKKLKEGDVLVFSFIGYETKEFKVPKSDYVQVELSLKLDLDVSVLGEVSTTELYHEEPSSARKLWNTVKSVF
jgi:hypothetical protein